MPRNASKPKKKLKTHRGAAKRFKVTATGKFIRMHSGKRHLLGTKKSGRMRKLKKLTLVNKADVAAVQADASLRVAHSLVGAQHCCAPSGKPS